MIIANEQRVGGVQIAPAEFLPAPQGYPGVGGVGALQPWFARRGDRADIAAHIEGGQAKAAQARDHDMGEILTDPAALFEGLAQRRRDGGGFRIIFEIGLDARHQFGGGLQHRTSRREALLRVEGRGGIERHEAAGIEAVDGRERIQRAGGHGVAADLLPGGRQAGRGGLRAIHTHAGQRRHAQLAVGRGDAHGGGAVAEGVDALDGLGGRRRHVEAAVEHLLPLLRARQQAQGAARGGDGIVVAIGRHMANVVDHARPSGGSAPPLEGPCRK